jgi:hypothetical protein
MGSRKPVSFPGDQNLSTTNAQVEPEAKRPSSLRKIQSNRQNAQKSTGPTTPEGKSYSRRNALKHGFFADSLFKEPILQREDLKKFKALYDGLREDWRPVGVSEELEVERIAICWWKLLRALQFENAHLQLQLGGVAMLAEKRSSRDRMDPTEKELFSMLEEAAGQIKDGGQISQDLSDKISDHDILRDVWTDIYKKVHNLVEQKRKEDATAIAEAEGITMVAARRALQTNPEMQAKYIGMSFALPFQFAMQYLELRVERVLQNSLEVSYDYKSIPDAEELDKGLRYEAAADRQLNRAIDRLERMQRRRSGDSVHSVDVRLSR